jgi:hypothetical protein
VRVPKGAGPASVVTDNGARKVQCNQPFKPPSNKAQPSSSYRIRDAILDDARVDTKHLDDKTFGNDSVDTKPPAEGTFGNDGVGFIRVRKRKIKGGHAEWREYRARNGTLATTSTSYDLVRAVRVNGKPRHKFVLGLGSLKDYERDSDVVWFWVRALRRMIRHGLDENQRQRLAAEMARKGARLPTTLECEQYDQGWCGRFRVYTDEIKRW